MKLNDKLYDFLKWVALVALPALAVFLTTVLTSLDLDPTATVVIVNATALFIGSLIGVSQLTRKKGKHVLQVREEE